MYDEGISINDVKMVVDGLKKEGIESKRYCIPDKFQTTDLLKGRKPGEVIIGAADTVLELGHPVTASVCLGMLTDRDDLVADGQVMVVGKELLELPQGRYSFALIVIAECAEVNEGCRQVVARKMSSCDSLVGCMARVLQDRIWIRFSKDAVHRGISLEIIGGHLISEIKKENESINKVEVIIVVAEKDHINRLRPIVESLTESRNAMYKAELGKRDDCDNDLDCHVCPDSVLCQVFKEAMNYSRKKERTH